MKKHVHKHASKSTKKADAPIKLTLPAMLIIDFLIQCNDYQRIHGKEPFKARTKRTPTCVQLNLYVKKLIEITWIFCDFPIEIYWICNSRNTF